MSAERPPLPLVPEETISHLYGSRLSPETAQLLERDLPCVGLEYLLPVMPYTPPVFFSMKC